MDRFLAAADAMFEQHGRRAAKRPFAFISAVAILVVVLGIGMGRTTTESNSKYLFTPVDSQAEQDENRFNRLFAGLANPGDEAAILIARDEQHSVLSEAGISSLEEVQRRVEAVTTEFKGETLTFADLCERGPDGDCLVSSILPCAHGNASNPIPFPFCPNDRGSQVVFAPSWVAGVRSASPMPPSHPLAGLGGRDPSEQSLVSDAEAARIMLYVKGSDAFADKTAAWELAVLDALEEAATDLADAAALGEAVNGMAPGFVLAFKTNRSVDDALAVSQGGDIMRFVLVLILLMTFAVLNNLSCSPVSTRAMIVMQGVLVAGLAIPPAFGLMGWCGVSSVATIGVTPFLVLGVGVDSVFVITAAFNRTPSRWTVEERVAETAKEAGVAITITSITDTLAFLIGATSPFRAVRFFVAYTGTAVFFGYLLMLFLFLPLVALDARREASGRSAYTCRRVLAEPEASNASDQEAAGGFDASGAMALESKKEEEPTPAVDGAAVKADGGKAGDGNANGGDGADSAGKVGNDSSANEIGRFKSAIVQSVFTGNYPGVKLDQFFARRLAPSLQSTAGLTATLVIWIAYLAFGVFATSNISQGLDLWLLAPDDHHIVPFFKNQNAYFPFQVAVVSVVEGDPVWTHDMLPAAGSFDFRSAQVRADVQACIQDLAAGSRFFGQADATWIDHLDTLMESGRYPSLPTAGSDLTESQWRDALSALLTDEETALLVSGTIVLEALSAGDAEPRRLPVPNLDDDGLIQRAIANNDTIRIAASAALVRTVVISSTTDQADALTEFYEVADDVVASDAARRAGVNSLFVTHPVFRFWAQYQVIVGSTLSTLGMAIACMLVVASVLLPRVRLVAIVVLALISIDIGVFGVMYILGIQLNSISSIILVIGIGFSVDTSSHICHAFLRATGEGFWPLTERGRADEADGCFGGDRRRARAVEALTLMGRPVSQGALSTLIGLLAMVGASSYIFRTFFALLFAVISLGLLHGLTMIPALMALFGPGLQPNEDHQPAKTQPAQDQEAGSTPPLGAVAAPSTASSTAVVLTSPAAKRQPGTAPAPSPTQPDGRLVGWSAAK